MADRWCSRQNRNSKNTMLQIPWVSRWALTAKIILYYTLECLSPPSVDDQQTPTISRKALYPSCQPTSNKETWGAIDTEARSVVLSFIEIEPNGAQGEKGQLVDPDMVRSHCEFLVKKLRCFRPNPNSLETFLQEQNCLSPRTSQDPVFVQKWVLANDEIVFLFSDGCYQLNFRNHYKIIIFGQQGLLSWYAKKAPDEGGKKKSSTIETVHLPNVSAWLKQQEPELVESTWRLLRTLI
ncbi:hypothetical protein Ciccas_011311 [Cichlidogyrus casuarinus]|uniref:Uncharacterized protein n=1 Tax=Cichlidogyrus casuarinus TaxID=1844966 RepID=A0ABD2PRN3_9PLAT